MRVLSLCSGIGGIDWAAEASGMEVVGQVEIDAFCQAVLAKHWPHVTRLGDLKEVQGDEFGTIDLVAGGIPCQPYSRAGKRKGASDDRNLWPEAFRLVQAIRPRWVVIENVTGLIDLGLDIILADLENAGYTGQTFVIPASAVGAPQQRERVFIVAYAARHLWRASRNDRPTSSDGASDTQSMADARRERQSERGVRGGTAQVGTLLNLWTGNSGEDVVNASSAGRQEWHAPAEPGSAGHVAGRFAALWGPRQIKSSLGRGVARLSDWLDRRWPARPGEAQHDWEPPRTTQERIPNRAARLKALGNAVVPQQILPIFQAIVAAEQEEVA